MSDRDREQQRAVGRERLAAFMAALRALCKEHGASIGGCGCCGSPWVDVAGESQEDVNIDYSAPPDSAVPDHEEQTDE